jgi:hypothetical protein
MFVTNIEANRQERDVVLCFPKAEEGAGALKLRQSSLSLVSSEQQFDCELCRARTTNCVEGVLSAPRSTPAQGVVCCGVYLAEAQGSKLGVWLVEPWRSKHRVVENIEVFYANIDLEAFGQIETATQREIRLIDRVWAAQTVPGEVSHLSRRGEREGSRVQCSATRLGRIGDPIELIGHDASLQLVIADCGRLISDGYIDRWR